MASSERVEITVDIASLQEGLERLERVAGCLGKATRAIDRLAASLELLGASEGDEGDWEDPQSMGWVGSDGRP